MKVMSAKMESDIAAFEVEVEKFSARWQQLKPKDELALDRANRDSINNAIASLKDRRKEFNELVTVSQNLMLVFTGIKFTRIKFTRQNLTTVCQDTVYQHSTVY